MNCEITTDPARLDVAAIHAFLTQAYWSRGIPRETVERAIANSLCFGALRDGRQVGFARVVTDRTTFAWLADVFVLESERGQGIARRLVEAVLAHPDLQGLRRIMLGTRYAHGLYAKYGFKPVAPAAAASFMEITWPDRYSSPTSAPA
jgi:GNAT superfamily N-acetyltransferase